MPQGSRAPTPPGAHEPRPPFGWFVLVALFRGVAYARSSAAPFQFDDYAVLVAQESGPFSLDGLPLVRPRAPAAVRHVGAQLLGRWRESSRLPRRQRGDPSGRDAGWSSRWPWHSVGRRACVTRGWRGAPAVRGRRGAALRLSPDPGAGGHVCRPAHVVDGGAVLRRRGALLRARSQCPGRDGTGRAARRSPPP